MPISDESWHSFTNETSKTLGNIESSLKALHDYLDAVNENQKATAKELNGHKEDLEAHGAKSRNGVFASIAAVVAFIGSIVGIVIAVRAGH